MLGFRWDLQVPSYSMDHTEEKIALYTKIQGWFFRTCFVCCFVVDDVWASKERETLSGSDL